MPKFLIDEDCPRGLERLLVSKGLDAVHVVTAGLSGVKDPDLFVWAQAQGRIIISRDLGWANLLTYPLGTHPGLIVIRVPYTAIAPEIVALLDQFLSIANLKELSGALVILEPEQYRIRKPARQE